MERAHLPGRDRAQFSDFQNGPSTRVFYFRKSLITNGRTTRWGRGTAREAGRGAGPPPLPQTLRSLQVSMTWQSDHSEYCRSYRPLRSLLIVESTTRHTIVFPPAGSSSSQAGGNGAAQPNDAAGASAAAGASSAAGGAGNAEEEPMQYSSSNSGGGGGGGQRR